MSEKNAKRVVNGVILIACCALSFSFGRYYGLPKAQQQQMQQLDIVFDEYQHMAQRAHAAEQQVQTLQQDRAVIANHRQNAAGEQYGHAD